MASAVAAWLSFVWCGVGMAQSPAVPWQIQGTILDGVTELALANVRIALRGTELAATTDREGRFVLTGIVSGEALLTAERTGYISLRLPDRTVIGNSGIPLTLGPGQQWNETLRLFPAGSISGQLITSSGDVVRGRSLALLYEVYSDMGQAVWRTAASVPVNDRGEFRFNGVEPGKYKIKIDGVRERVLVTQVSPPTYYPNVLSVVDASTIEVSRGAEVRLGTLVLRAVPAHQLTLRPVPGFGEVASNASFSIASVDDASVLHTGRLSSPVSVSVASGTYDLSVTASGPTGAGVVRSHRLVEVAGGNRTVDIELPRAALVSVQTLYREGSAAATPAPAVSLIDATLQRPVFADFGILDQLLQRTSDGNGESTFPRVAPGRYRIHVSGLAPGLYVTAITDGDGRNADGGFDVADDQRNVAIVNIARAATSVAGSIVDKAGKPVPGATVVLLPTDSPNSAAIFTGRSTASGAFEFLAAPGNYHAYAWRELEGAAYRNAAFMAEFQARGVAISLGDATATVGLILRDLADADR